MWAVVLKTVFTPTHPEIYLLCISLSEQVLCRQFAGQINLFQHFAIFFHQKEKKEEKVLENWAYQDLGATLRCWQISKSWSSQENMNFLNFA